MSAVLLEENLLVGVQDNQVLVAIVREADFFTLGTLGQRVKALGYGSSSAVFNGHRIASQAYLMAGVSLQDAAECAGIPVALLEELQQLWKLNRSNEPTFAVVEGVELSESAQRLHQAGLTGDEVKCAVAVEVSVTGDAALLARRPKGREVVEQALMLPTTLVAVQRMAIDDYVSPSP